MSIYVNQYPKSFSNTKIVRGRIKKISFILEFYTKMGQTP